MPECREGSSKAQGRGFGGVPCLEPKGPNLKCKGPLPTLRTAADHHPPGPPEDDPPRPPCSASATAPDSS
eukprot:829681-Prorocentrum_minimum.AAC.1